MKPLTYRPLTFFSLVYLLSWLPWMLAAYFSYRPNGELITLLLALLGLLGPLLAALIMLLTSDNQDLDRDCRNRLLSVSAIAGVKLWFILLLMPVGLLVATLISLPFGLSADQFNFSAGFLAMLPVAVIAALLEELGWRSYGVDSLQGKRSMLAATLIFGLLWALWHAPLFLINQTYQQGLWELGPLYVANFFISVFPAAILANWFYYRCGRSIPSAVLFHFLLVANAELLQTEPLTKCILTALLIGVCIVLVAANRSFFFSRFGISTDKA